MPERTSAEKTTEVIFILDRSGSMYEMAGDTIGGFNSTLLEQKKGGGDVFVTTVLFNDRCEILHDHLPIQSVPLMTAKDYQARGNTALLDAMGHTITRVVNAQKALSQDHQAEKVLCVVITDGYENASREYSYAGIKSLITCLRSTKNWNFMFLGANIEAAEEAERLGISRANAARYCADSQGSRRVYHAVSDAVMHLCMDACCDPETSIEEDLAQVREDYAKRRK